MEKSGNENSLHVGIKLHALNVMKPAVNIDTMNNSTTEENIDSPGNSADIRTEKANHSKAESLSSSEEGEYISCTNSVVPDEASSRPSPVVPPEPTCNVKMSANMASKLNQMRESRESLVDNTENGEDLIDEMHEQPHMDPDAQSASSNSQKPLLRQVFPCNSCLPFENNIVFCFVLSVWDNIVGPQTVNVWKRKSFPTQKTFDDLFEGEVELGEDLTNIRRASIQSLLGMEATLQSTPTSVAGSWPEKQNEGRINSRSYSSTSNDSDMYSSTEQERKSPTKRIGRLFSSTRLLSSPRLNRDANRGLSSSAEAFCEDFGNSILMQSLSTIKDKPKTTQGGVDSRPEDSQDEGAVPVPRVKEQVLQGDPAKIFVDNEGEQEGQGIFQIALCTHICINLILR